MARNKEGAAAAEQESVVDVMLKEEDEKRIQQLEATYQRAVKDMGANMDFGGDAVKKAKWQETMRQGREFMIEKALDTDEPDKALIDMMLSPEQVEGMIEDFEKEMQETAEQIASEDAEEEAAMKMEEKMDSRFAYYKQTLGKAATPIRPYIFYADKLKGQMFEKAKAEAEKNGTDAADELKGLMHSVEYMSTAVQEHVDANKEERAEQAEVKGVETTTAAELGLETAGVGEIKDKFDVVAEKLSFTWEEFTAPEPTGFLAKAGGFFNKLFGGISKKDKMVGEISDMYAAEYGTTPPRKARVETKGPTGKGSVRGEN